MELNKDSYEDVLGELYDKYKSTGKKMEPEIKLILMISASAASFHASKKMAESMPGLDSVLKTNPDLLSKLQNMVNKNISNQGNTKENDGLTQEKMYEEMHKLKEQQKQFDEIKKAQNEVSNNTAKIQEQLNSFKKNNEEKENNSLLDKLKAEHISKSAENLINKVSDSTEERVSINETISTSDTAITLGSDGKPKRKRKNGKTIISIAT